MGHMDQIKAAFDSETKKYNYDKTFEKIKPILSDADITIGNLEVTLGVRPYSGYPQFSSPVEYASAIKASGVDVLVTANNHSCDKGKLGLERTIRLLDSLNIGHTGTFTDLSQKQKSPCYIIKKNNMKIALINYTYGTNEIPPTHPNIVNYLDKKTVSSDVDLIRKEINPDQIIAFVHWGYQYQNMPNKKQLEWFEFFNSVKLNRIVNKSYDSDVVFKNDVKAILGNKIYNKNDGLILETATQMNASIVLFGILGFIACFAFSLGPVMWVLLSELFPLKFKGLAIGFIAFINSLISSLVQLIFPWEISNLGNSLTFFIFGFIALVGFFILFKILPETKGKSLEELEIAFQQ